MNRAPPNEIYVPALAEVSQGGSTPLLFAARQGDAKSARLLLDAGASANDRMPDGTTALVMAVHSNHPAVATLLLEKGANANDMEAGYHALHAAVLRGNLDLVKALLARGAAVNARISHGTTTIRASRNFFLPETLAGATPFVLAAKFLEVNIMRVLAASGADVWLTLNDGTTPVMAAAGLPVQPDQFDRRDRLSLVRDPDEALTLEAIASARRRCQCRKSPG